MRPRWGPRPYVATSLATLCALLLVGCGDAEPTPEPTAAITPSPRATASSTAAPPPSATPSATPERRSRISEDEAVEIVMAHLDPESVPIVLDATTLTGKSLREQTLGITDTTRAAIPQLSIMTRIDEWTAAGDPKLYVIVTIQSDGLAAGDSPRQLQGHVIDAVTGERESYTYAYPVDAEHDYVAANTPALESPTPSATPGSTYNLRVDCDAWAVARRHVDVDDTASWTPVDVLSARATELDPRLVDALRVYPLLPGNRWNFMAVSGDNTIVDSRSAVTETVRGAVLLRPDVLLVTMESASATAPGVNGRLPSPSNGVDRSCSSMLLWRDELYTEGWVTPVSGNWEETVATILAASDGPQPYPSVAPFPFYDEAQRANGRPVPWLRLSALRSPVPIPVPWCGGQENRDRVEQADPFFRGTESIPCVSLYACRDAGRGNGQRLCEGIGLVSGIARGTSAHGPWSRRTLRWADLRRGVDDLNIDH